MSAERIDEKTIMAVAKRLKQIREERGLSQTTVYIDTDYNLGRIEVRKTNISISTLALLCKYYEISLEEFFKGMK
jgi:transcriptional regulator with XRE-family HTH domain